MLKRFAKKVPGWVLLFVFVIAFLCLIVPRYPCIPLQYIVLCVYDNWLPITCWLVIAPVLFLLLVKWSRVRGYFFWKRNNKKTKRRISKVLDKLAGAEKINKFADQKYPARTLGNLKAAELINWATDDTPVEKSGEDYFGYVHFAKRIAVRMRPAHQSEPSNKFIFPSFGIRGGFGCGKSSVVNMTERILETANPRSCLH